MNDSQKADAIIVAAGSGARFGAAKQFAMLGNVPLYQHCLKTFAGHPMIARIVLVIPADEIGRIEKEISSSFHGKKIEIALGGAVRQDSVSNGLQKLEESGEPDIILVHDAARPFVTTELITKVIDAAKEFGAALAAIPLGDTLKHSEDGLAMATIPRNDLWRAQTPQAARYDLLKKALEAAHADSHTGTDESELLERIGIHPFLVLGEERNMKITYEQDLRIISDFS